MATQIVQLDGGPSAGVELGYQVPPPLPEKINYSGAVYDNAHKTKQDSAGDTVHVFSYNAVASGEGLAAPRTHHGWHDVRRSVNHNWGAALKDSDRQIRAALRSIGRARKVKL